MEGKLTEKIINKANIQMVNESRKDGNRKVQLKKGMSIPDMIKAIQPEIRKALPSMITPERFTRMALSSLNNNPQLLECTPMSFIAALMDAAQLGLEPNTPLGQAYLIPYRNKDKGVVECQFQIGYKGLIDLAYRNERLRSIEAHTVYENDEFYYELGLDARLKHIPAWDERGDIKGFYAVFKLDNGGYRFEVMSKNDVDKFRDTYSKTANSVYSPWNTSYEEMAKKTVIKRVLKYAPLKAEFKRALTLDGTVKTDISMDMSEVVNEPDDDKKIIEGTFDEGQVKSA